jgi:signal transduction histidine kinase
MVEPSIQPVLEKAIVQNLFFIPKRTLLVKHPGLFLLLAISIFQCQAQQADIAPLKQRLAAISDSFAYVNVLNRIGTLSYEQDTDSTLYYAYRARTIAERLQYKRGLADAANNFGIVYDIKGYYPLALRYYNDGYTGYVSIGDSANIAKAAMNLAIVYGSMDQADKSLARYREALSIALSLKNDSILPIVIFNYFWQFSDRFSTDSVGFYIDKASAVATKHHDWDILCTLQRVRAKHLIGVGMPDSGINVLQRALSDGLGRHLFYTSLEVMIHLGDLYSSKDSARAVEYYERALDFGQNHDWLPYSKQSAQKLYTFYTVRKNKEKAFFYADKLMHLYVRSAEIERSSGVDYIDYAIKDQQLEAARQRSADDKKLLWLALFACLLAFVVIFVLWRSAKRIRMTHALLREQFARLESTSDALTQSNIQYSRLLKVVAHDLRNPIGAIRGISSILGRDLNEPSKSRDLLAMINQSSERCLELISELMQTDFVIREESLHRGPVDISLLVRQTVELLRFRAADKAQSIVLQDGAPKIIQADKDQLSRVLDNLIINAMKFSPNESTIAVALKEEDGVLISVQDRGIGIPGSIAHSLFDPFTSGKRKGTAGEHTFGLGLYISKQIVEAHGGRIWFESKENSGTTFFVKLPK